MVDSAPHSAILTTIARNFRLKDRVEVTMVGHTWGRGTIIDKSTTDYGGTALYPVYCIENDEGGIAWVPAVSLERL